MTSFIIISRYCTNMPMIPCYHGFFLHIGASGSFDGMTGAD